MSNWLMALIATGVILLFTGATVGAVCLFVSLSLNDNPVIAWIGRITGVICFLAFCYLMVYIKIAV